MPVIVCSKSSHWNEEHREKNPGCVGGAEDSKYLEEAKSKDLRNRKGAQVFPAQNEKKMFMDNSTKSPCFLERFHYGQHFENL